MGRRVYANREQDIEGHRQPARIESALHFHDRTRDGAVGYLTQKSFERPIGTKDWRKETYTGNKWKVTRTLKAGDLFAMAASDDRLCLHAAANGNEWRWVLGPPRARASAHKQSDSGKS